MKGSNSTRIFRTMTGMLVIAAVLLSACQPAAEPKAAPEATLALAPTDAPATEAPAAPAETESVATPAGVDLAEATVNVVDSAEFGPILVDDEGMTLYIFTKDEPDKSNCAGECLEKWPPLLTQGEPTLGEGVDPALVGSTTLPDGSKIVTYNHMPLYYWWKDVKAGDTDGQGVGEVWYVINPAGEVIKGDAASETPAPAADAPAEATVNMVESAEFGPILVDGEGMTLYIFTKDEPDKSNCAGECLEKWPPLLTQGEPTLGEGVDPALVSSTTLPDGSKIVTYNHMPLYYWFQDAKAGDTDGQGVGEVWYVINPAGEVIGQQPVLQPTAMKDDRKDDDSGGDY